MAGITLEQAQAKLDGWIKAEEELQVSQSYRLPDGRQVTKADLGEIGRRIEYWNRMVIRLSRGGIKVNWGVPV